MTQEDLIKKLESIALPDVELQNHKRALRMTLLNSPSFKRPTLVMILKKSFVFAAPALTLTMILGLVVLQPKLAEAQAMKIARNDEAVRGLMADKNMNFKEVKIKNGKAYILLNKLNANTTSASENVSTNGNMGFELLKEVKNQDIKNNIEGAIVEINLKEKKVAGIQTVSGEDVAPLAGTEKEEATIIVSQERIIREIVPPDAKIKKIESVMPGDIHLRFNEENKEIQAVADSSTRKKAKVHYTTDGKDWIVTVDLERNKVETLQIASDKN